MTLLQAVMAWQVYEISHSALYLGFLGLIRFGPALGVSLVGGAVADSYNRRNIVMGAQCLPLACSTLLLAATLSDWVSLGLIYGFVLVIGLASAFENPARVALLPTLVPPEMFANAVTVNSTVQTLGAVTGPTLAGLVIATAGVGAAYGVHAGLIAGSLASLLFVPYRQTSGPRRSVSLQAIREGIAFVRRRQVLIGAMTLDMFAVVFGGASALLPIYATKVLDVGPRGYGLLTASFQIGAFLMAGVLVLRPPIEDMGRALLAAVFCFGAGTIAFGLSRSFPVSLGAYMFIGMADQVSVVARNTTIQLSTPDELRGRVSAVSQVFIGASNQLGAAESGFVAALTSATFAVVSGGIGCLAVLGAVAVRLPELRSYRIGTAPAEASVVESPAAIET